MLRTITALLATMLTATAQCTTAIVPLPGGTDGPVSVLRRLANGDILVAGTFSTLFNVPAGNIARWNGTTVQPLGAGLGGPVRDAIELPNGDIVAGGAFATAGGAPIANLAVWNGSSWAPFGTGPSGPVRCIATRPNGELYVGVEALVRVQRWNGSTWSGIGLAPFPFPYPGLAPVTAMHTLPNGDLVLSGVLLMNVAGSSYDMVRWNGTTLQPMPGLGIIPQGSQPTGSAGRFYTLRDGSLCAAGGWTAEQIVRWNGSSWLPFAGASSALGAAHDMCELPNGDLVLGGGFFYLAPNQAARGVARRQNGVWSPFGAGVTGLASTFLPLPSGEILVGGQLSLVDGQPAQNLALLVPTCPAAATTSGMGCVGSGGLLALTPLSLPYCGSSQRSRATGVPANAIGVGILGAASVAVPLSSLLAQAQPGCSLLASPDELTLLPATGGAVTTSITIPNAQALVGIVLQQQVAVAEIGVGGGIHAITTSNALSLTIGSF
jgi:hypothetical protein